MKKNLISVLFLGGVFALCLTMGCRRKDIRRVEIRTPGVRSEECARRAVRSLRSLRGINFDAVEVDTDSGTLAVEYDSMVLALKNIELALTEAGFDANELPADPEAAAGLPAECRDQPD